MLERSRTAETKRKAKHGKVTPSQLSKVKTADLTVAASKSTANEPAGRRRYERRQRLGISGHGMPCPYEVLCDVLVYQLLSVLICGDFDFGFAVNSATDRARRAS